jgi:hypothetical protein
MIIRHFAPEGVPFSIILDSYIENLLKNGIRTYQENSIIESNTPLHLVKELKLS